MIQPDIYITETHKKVVTGSNDPRQIIIPWLPDEICFSSNETRFASYNILDLGEVKIPAGANIHSYSWEGILPGEGRKNSPLQRGDWQDPKRIQSIWSMWREYGTPLRLLIVGTPVNHDVYLEDYEVTYSGAFGDYSYTISFVDARDIAIGGSAKSNTSSTPASSSPGNSGSTGSSGGSASSGSAPAPASRPETQSNASSYTTVSGDTLWSIATRFLGNGARWPEIYLLNQSILEIAAKNAGHESSSYGTLIFPGTKLQLRK